MTTLKLPNSDYYGVALQFSQPLYYVYTHEQKARVFLSESEAKAFATECNDARLINRLKTRWAFREDFAVIAAVVLEKEWLTDRARDQLGPAEAQEGGDDSKAVPKGKKQKGSKRKKPPSKDFAVSCYNFDNNGAHCWEMSKLSKVKSGLTRGSLQLGEFAIKVSCAQARRMLHDSGVRLVPMRDVMKSTEVAAVTEEALDAMEELMDPEAVIDKEKAERFISFPLVAASVPSVHYAVSAGVHKLVPTEEIYKPEGIYV